MKEKSKKIDEAYKQLACAVLNTVVEDGYYIFFDEHNEIKDAWIHISGFPEELLKRKTKETMENRAKEELELIPDKPVSYSVKNALKTKKFKTQTIADFFGWSYHEVNQLKTRMKKFGIL